MGGGRVEVALLALLAAASVLGAARAADPTADCRNYPPRNSGVVPTAFQGRWTGPFSSQGYEGTVKLYLGATSYVMDATVQAGSVTMPVNMPQCGLYINVTAAGTPDVTVNMSTYYVGTGAIPNRTPDSCLTFVIVNTTGVITLRSAQALEQVSADVYRGVCVDAVPATSTASISVTTYSVLRNGAAATAVSASALLLAALAAAFLTTSASRTQL